MKYGVRTPSVSRRISARTSVKRYARHSAGLKAPKGAGWATNPKKAAYNRVYNRTSISVDRLARSASGSRSQAKQAQEQFPVLGISYRPAKVGSLTRISAYFSSDPTLKAKIKVDDAMRQLNVSNYQAALGLAIEARNLDSNSGDALFIMAICYNNLQQHKEALDSAKAALKFMPNTQEILLIYAIASFNLNKFEQTLKTLDKLNDEAQLSFIVLKTKALSFYNLKRYSEAIATLKQAPLRKRNLTEPLIEIHYWLARAFEAQGKKKDAIKHYEKISTVWFDFEDIQERMNTLRDDSTK